MRESISYTFLLNIIITFVFVCFAIIMGIFSYFRAFKANNIIINEIEKYEGFNCLSEASIKQKLQGISYNVPFEASCNASDGEKCAYDNEKNYAVISYNIEHDRMDYINNEDMNSQYRCEGIDNTGCEQTYNYQYGVYTYMYVDLPVVSKLIRLKVYGKTNLMTEYRTFIKNSKGVMIDENYMPDDIKKGTAYLNSPVGWFAVILQDNYVKSSVGLPTSDGVTSRSLFQYDPNQDGKYDGIDASYVGSENAYQFDCGYIRDYNKN